MANEIVVPILPCADIDEIVDFYRMLGFELTYLQQRPYPCAGVRYGDADLQFAGIPGFDPEQSYGSCIVAVDDTAEIFEEFAAGMRAVHGKLLVAGIPRITRPRKRKNADGASGFSVVDPGGNWIRVFQRKDTGADTTPATEPLARALENAVVLGDSKGDARQAAKILDGKLTKADAATPVPALVEALVYRAELALRLDDPGRAEELFARLDALDLTDAQRASLAESLATAADLRKQVSSER
ncbi:VOC family protein [Actinomadura sp. 7K507]|uniref:VOC family protein n=1 Tax=Actinomadura sp. 7K507 TaxID=2530365 RepID=UPI0010428EEC|nr:VOC family protein [Actinomadura sp. 7K507]TDC79431.1 VOC family protein [Actinomadura sp. 7K507]